MSIEGLADLYICSTNSPSYTKIWVIVSSDLDSMFLVGWQELMSLKIIHQDFPNVCINQVTEEVINDDDKEGWVEVTNKDDL